MSKILEIQNFWGMKINGLRFEKNTNKGCKIAAQKKFLWADFALLSRVFFGIGATIHISQEILCLLHAGFFLSVSICFGISSTIHTH